MRSMKTMPGSPFFHARVTMVLKTLRALSFFTVSPERGLTSAYSASCSTARMNASVTATEMLKLLSLASSCLAVMKSRMSGWSTRMMPMLAPRRVPPCLMVSVAASNTLMKESGPDDTPLVLSTRSFLGRTREKENPVPPPLLWMRAVFLTASKMESMESPTGRTKQADSWPSSRPAFMSVGLLGRNSRSVISP